MEENVSFLKEIHEVFGECDTDIRTYSPLTFAYIGDAVFEMIVRTLIVEHGQRAANTLHKHTTKIVCAGTQAALAEAVMEEMTEEERDIFRRGKNTKLHSTAKNATLADYRRATGFEAVCGYLYLSGRTKRVMELVKSGMDKLEIKL